MMADLGTVNVIQDLLFVIDDPVSPLGGRQTNSYDNAWDSTVVWRTESRPTQRRPVLGRSPLPSWIKLVRRVSGNYKPESLSSYSVNANLCR